MLILLKKKKTIRPNSYVFIKNYSLRMYLNRELKKVLLDFATRKIKKEPIKLDNCE